MKIKPMVFAREPFILEEGRFSPQDRLVSISVDAFNLEDSTPYRVFVAAEPPPISNHWYSSGFREVVPNLINNHRFYHLILAWHEEVLSRCPNAVKLLVADSWVNPLDVGAMNKDFAVSFLTSSKNTCPGHVLRQEIFERLPISAGAVSISKRRTPPMIDSTVRLLAFTDFQFHITVENTRYNNYFTEKVLDCFVTKTVPIYYGCPNLGEYFNTDGVLTFGTYEELERVLRSLTPASYLERAAATEDNFRRVLEYRKTSFSSRVDLAIKTQLDKLR